MKLLTSIFLAAFCASAEAAILNVPAQYATIQQGLDAAEPGDSVLVAEGTYHENIVWPQTNDLHLLGAPSNSQRPVIDGSSVGRVIDVETDGSTPFTVEISGFEIAHGFLDVPAHAGASGAGIFVSNAALTISNCLLRGNVITSTFAIQNNGGGAGLSIVSTPSGYTNRIEGCNFSSNRVSGVTSGDAPAIHLDGAATQIKNTVISGNTISTNEVALGMIYDFASDLSLTAVKIENNKAETTQSLLPGFAAIKGTALFSYLSNVDLVDCKIAGNKSTPQNSTLGLLGGAVYFYGEGTRLRILSSSIAYNERTDGAPTSGTALFFTSTKPHAGLVTNSISWNPGDGVEIDSFSKPAAVEFSDIRDGSSGTAVINSDPLFVSTTDLHLQPASPCINAGTNPVAPPRDIDGRPRPLPAGSQVDLGCYESDL